MKTPTCITRCLTLVALAACIGPGQAKAQNPPLSFTWSQTAPNTIQFTNTSPVVNGGKNWWYFSAVPPVYAAEQANWSSWSVNPTHIYMIPGTYQVKLYRNDSLNGGIPDSTMQTIQVTGNVMCGLYSTSYGQATSCATCSDGYAAVTYNQGYAPYTYSWSGVNGSTDSLKNLSSGNYYCTVTDANGCKTVDTVSIPAGVPCNIQFTANVNGNYLYLNNTTTGITHVSQTTWTIYSKGAVISHNPYSYLPSGHYYVCMAVTDSMSGGGCNGTYCDSVIIPAGQNCQAAFALASDSLHPGNFKALNNSIAGASAIYQYQWSWGDGSALDSGATPSHTYASAGVYQICLKITTLGGCTSSYCTNVTAARYAVSALAAHTTINVVMGHPAGIAEEPKALASWNLFPNPSNDVLHVAYSLNENAAVDIRLYNLMGQEVMQVESTKSQTSGAHRVDASLSQLDPGTYLLRIVSNGHRESKRLVVIR
jgi:hypothetical protein